MSQLRTVFLGLMLAATLILLNLPVVGQGNGQFLCSAGSRDGQSCEAFEDCPGGVCVIAQGICPDAFICDCPGGSCTETILCSEEPSFGTCASGVLTGRCCDVALECLDGGACVGTQKVCVGGSDEGFSCINNTQCTGGTCASTGCFCDGGDFDSYACFSTIDCPGGDCDCSFGPTPTPTPPITTDCVGDCSNDRNVTVDEIVVGVNIALGETTVGACRRFDGNQDGDVTVDELLVAINNALVGCA